MTPDRPLISVVIPLRDAETFVGRSIACALDQTWPSIEVIVADDGSRDGGAAVVEAAARRDSRVRLLRGAAMGVSAARNRAIAASRGAFIAPLDADDLWRPDKLERQMARLAQSGPDVGLVYCWTTTVDEAGRIMEAGFTRGRARGEVLDDILQTGLIGNASVPLIRRERLQAVGGYDETLRLGEDWDLHARLAAVCRFEVVEADLVGYRIRAGAATQEPDWPAELDRSTRKLRRMFPDAPRAVWRRRAAGIENLLAFIAMRRGAHAEMVAHRLRAFALRPDRLLSADLTDFLGLLVGSNPYVRRCGSGTAFLEPGPSGSPTNRSAARS